VREHGTYTYASLLSRYTWTWNVVEHVQLIFRLTLTLILTLINPNLNSNPTLTLTLRRVTKVQKWTSPFYPCILNIYVRLVRCNVSTDRSHNWHYCYRANLPNRYSSLCWRPVTHVWARPGLDVCTVCTVGCLYSASCCVDRYDAVPVKMAVFFCFE